MTQNNNNEDYYIDHGLVYKREPKKKTGVFWKNLEKFKKQTKNNSDKKQNGNNR